MFADIYSQLRAASSIYEGEEESNQPVFSYAIESMPVSQFIQILSMETGVSIVSDISLDEKPLSFQAVGLTVGEILSLVARRLSVDLTGSDGMYVLGSVRRQDRAVYVRKSARLAKEDLQRAIDTMLSDQGRAQVYVDGLVIVSDHVEILEKVDTLINRIESSPANVWLVQLYLVQADERTSREMGIDLTHELDLALVLAEASTGGNPAVSSGLVMQGLLQGVFRATMSSQFVELVAKPLFLLLDGEKGRISLGQRVPLPRRTVLENGSVTTSGFDFINSGFETLVTLREQGSDAVRVDVSIKIGEITGFVEGASIVSEQELTVASLVHSGGVYLIGSLERERGTNARDGNFGTLKRRESVSGSLQVWLRCYRVGGDAMAAAARRARGEETL